MWWDGVRQGYSFVFAETGEGVHGMLPTCCRREIAADCGREKNGARQALTETAELSQVSPAASFAAVELDGEGDGREPWR